jgi:O-antigen ligase
VAVSLRVSAKEFSWVCVLTVLGGAVAAATGYFLGFDENAQAAGEVRGRLTLGGAEKHNPNTLGAVLVLPLALAIGGFLGLRGLQVKTATITAVGAMAVGLFITMSRSSVLALATMLLVFLYRFRIRFSALVIVAVLIGALVMMPERFFERMSSTVSGKPADASAGRFDIWAAGVEALSEYWAIGAGYSNFPAAYSRYVTVGGLDSARVAHNTYLGTWIELGIVGLALMFLGVASHLVAANRIRGAPGGAGIALRAIEAAAFGKLVAGFFGDSLATKSFWMLWILLAWATRLVLESSTRPNPPQREDEAVPPALFSSPRRDHVA